MVLESSTHKGNIARCPGGWSLGCCKKEEQSKKGKYEVHQHSHEAAQVKHQCGEARYWL